MKSVFTLLMLLMLPQMANADIVSDLFKTQKISCFIIGILDTQNDKGFEFNFEVNINGESDGGHGGSERSFTFENHEVTVIANDRWMGIAWWMDGKKLGEAVTLSTVSNAQSRVMLLMNPDNENERVSITCEMVN